jgi:Na+/proline symporter
MAGPPRCGRLTGMEETTRTRRPERTAARPYLWIVGLVWVLPAVGTAVGYAVLPKHNSSGQCEGIGFGCVPSPADSLLLLAMFAAIPLLVLGLVLIIIVAVLQSRRR